MKSSSSLIFLLFFASIAGYSQPGLQTVAEKSDFTSTARYSDVMAFIGQLKKSSPYVRIETIAFSTGGMEVPLLVIGNPVPQKPSDLKNDKRIVVYIQANIHAGEVEGKEAVLMFARDLLKEKNPAILKNVVLLICPNFNPDGNEKIDTRNRTYQNGPVNGVGVRYNGQFLDLNRDAMKAESPEVRGVLTNVFDRWDPSVFMDCHTTDGSYHVEPVTFTWMVNPNGDKSLISYMSGKMIPEMSRTLRNKYKVENCYYGEFYDMANPEKGWVFDAAEPHYMSNYAGLRNRLSILNENYVYADYKSRVLGCYYLIHSLTDYAYTHAAEIKGMLSDTDKKTISRGMNPAEADSFAIEYKVNPMPDKVTIKTYEAEVVTGDNGRQSFKKTDRQIDVTVPYYIDYKPVKSVVFPCAYILTTSDPDITSLLKTHGIKVEKLAAATSIEVLRFEISELKGAPRLYQGHYMNSVRGNYVNEKVEFPAGTLVIRTAQPLANVAATLLEPQSNDGLLVWNFLDRYLVPQWGPGYNPCPVYKMVRPQELMTGPAFK
jgi:hypothetical protein